jgi:hypothetical protein
MKRRGSMLTSRSLFRARLAGLFLSTLFVLLVLVGCGGSGDGGEASKEKKTEAVESVAAAAGEFVGAIPGADTFLALVAEEPQEQGSQEEREVRAYLCDGRQLNEWFSGSASGEELQLASENGVQLDATLASEGASGTLTLSDGESFEFLAAPATGVEGFYPVNVTSSEVSGTSWRGGTLQGTRSGEQISGEITPPGGEEGEPIEVGITDPNIEEGEDRWIVLSEDGELRIKGAQRKATSSGSIDPSADKKLGFNGELGLE